MSKMQLMAILFFPGEAKVSIDGTVGIVQSITREDDSGNNFVVTIKVDYQYGGGSQLLEKRITTTYLRIGKSRSKIC